MPDFVVGDRYRLRQILVNLVGNAIKFTDAGEIVVDVRRLSHSGDEIVIAFSVRDTGTGIAVEKQKRVFDAFEQADESITRRYGGTGLGLSISSRLVALMGGKLELHSELGKGSTFHFTARLGLPSGDLPKRHDYPSKLLEGLHVLVVDDNATNCLILEEMLRSWRMRPETLTDSSQAIQLMRTRHREGNAFSLLLVDANMPDVDGFDLVEAVKRDPEVGSSITMMLTSSGWREEVSRCQQLGVAAYLTKPVKQSELFDMIATTMGAQSPHLPIEASTQGESPPATGRLRILLAEDSVVNQKLALAQLEPQGYQVTVAANGREAVAQWEAGSFDLILMDVQMPELDGLAATETIRQQERQSGRRVPIVAMTAYAMKGDRERCLAAGMDAYVSKPVRKQELLRVIAEVCAEAQPPAGEPAAQAADSSPAGDGEVLDWTAALDQTQIDPVAFGELIELFLQQSPHLLQQIREAITAGDSISLRRAAHTLKGSAAVFAARRTTQAALELETMAKEKNLGEAQAAYLRLERETELLRAALRQRLGEPEHGS